MKPTAMVEQVVIELAHKSLHSVVEKYLQDHQEELMALVKADMLRVFRSLQVETELDDSVTLTINFKKV